MVTIKEILEDEEAKAKEKEEGKTEKADEYDNFLNFLKIKRGKDETSGLKEFFDLWKDQDVEEIMVIGGEKPVYIFKGGKMIQTDVTLTEEEIVSIIREMAALKKMEVGEKNPILEMCLPNGDRVEAVLSAVAPEGSNITVRRFRRRSFSMLDLISFGTLNSRATAYLWLCVEGLGVKPANILVVGGTATGKTTFLNALTHFIERDRRIVTIEDVHELILMHDHRIHLESFGSGSEVSLDDLLRATLRMRPDRIIVGEVRGEEARTLFTAMNTGHDGCMGTLHANSAREAFDRLTNPPMSVPTVMLKALDVIVSLRRTYRGGKVRRYLAEIIEIGGTEGEKILTNTLFKLEPHGGLKEILLNGRYVQELAREANVSIKEINEELKNREKYIKGMLELKEKKEVAPEEFFEMIQEYYRASKC